MDFATGVGFLVGIAVVVTLVLLGGDLRMFYDVHALIVIGGGVLAATMIRFPFSGIAHGLPLGFKFAFSMRSSHPRELIEELTQIAEVVRKNGPMALESVKVDDSFLAQGIRYVADGYDKEFIKDTMERDRDIFLHHLEEGQKVYRSMGDCAPAWGMVGTLIGMIQMFANMSDPSKLGPADGDRASRHALRRARRQPVLPADRRQAACQARGGERLAIAHHRRHPPDPRVEEPIAREGDAHRLPA